MKICLLPNIIESANSLTETVDHDSIGLLILSTIIKREGHEVIYYNVNQKINDSVLSLHDKQLMSELAKELAGIDADIYGFSTIADGFNYQIILAEKLKKINKSCKILLGGPQASMYDLEIMENFSFIDYILRGESEESIVLFLNEFNISYKNFLNVKGLTFRDGERIQRNESIEPLDNLDMVPDIDYSMANLENKESFKIEVGRGCPFACSFCSSSTFFKRKYRMKSLRRIITEIDYLQNHYNISFLGFIHDLFTFKKEFITEFCHHVINSNMNLKWSCSARADSLDNELIQLMRKAGCIGIFIGIESGSEKMQKSINKRLDLNQAKKIVSYAVEMKMNVTTSFILGFPDETYEDVMETLKYRNELFKMGIQEAHMLILRPMQGSRIHENSKLMQFNMNLHLNRINKLNYNKEAIELIKKYPNIFSYYYMYQTEYLSENTVVALGSIVSTENFEVSEKLLWELEVDHLEFLHSFDSLSEDTDIFGYEEHYLKYLSKISNYNDKAWIVYEVAKYEKDKLDFLRFIDENIDNRQIEMRIKKYNIRVDRISGINEFMSFEGNKEETNYIFYYSPKALKIYIYQVGDEICNLVNLFFIGKTFKEVEEIFKGCDKLKNIALFHRLIADY